MHEGHRKRMLERLKNAEGSLQPHELLEILLFNAVPRKNTNEIAHRLLTSFGNLAEIFRADMKRLMTVKGVGEETAAYLRIIGRFMEQANLTDTERPSAYNFERFSKYLMDSYANLAQEIIVLFSVDNNGNLDFRREFTSGEAEKVELSPKEITKFIAECNPKAIIVVHNHLVKNSNPSPEDDKFTETVQLFCDLNGVILRDHLIVCPNGVYSYYLTRRLEGIKARFSAKNILEQKS